MVMGMYKNFGPWVSGKKPLVLLRIADLIQHSCFKMKKVKVKEWGGNNGWLGWDNELWSTAHLQMYGITYKGNGTTELGKRRKRSSKHSHSNQSSPVFIYLSCFQTLRSWRQDSSVKEKKSSENHWTKSSLKFCGNTKYHNSDDNINIKIKRTDSFHARFNSNRKKKKSTPI